MERVGAIPEDGRCAQGGDSSAHENWARATVSATCPVISGLQRRAAGLGRKKKGMRERFPGAEK